MEVEDEMHGLLKCPYAAQERARLERELGAMWTGRGEKEKMKLLLDGSGLRNVDQKIGCYIANVLAKAEARKGIERERIS